MNKEIRKMLIIGHGKEEAGVLFCGLKDMCDVIKNIFAIGTLFLTSMLLAFWEIVSPSVNSIPLAHILGVAGAFLLAPILIFLIMQLFFVVDHMPLPFDGMLQDKPWIKSAVSLAILVGIIIGLSSMLLIAIQSVQGGPHQ